MDEEEGKILIISAPSGAGKSSVVKKITEADTDFIEAISVTTRPPMGHERDGVDYFFRDDVTFKKMIKNSEFLEVAKIYDHFYGTTRNFVERLTGEGKNIIFNIDWQGAKIIRERSHTPVVSVFIMPPSMEELKRRLETRGQDSEVEILKKVKNAEIEISHKDEYDAVVVNDDLDQVVAEIIELVHK